MMCDCWIEKEKSLADGCCRAILALQASANRLGVYKLVKGDGGGKWKYRLMAAEVEYPRHHLHDVISVGIAETGRWLMSASMDTQICLWDLKGNLLHEVDTKIGTQHQAVVEPTGRFLAVCGFTPDVKVFEVKFDAKSGAFLECKRAFELKVTFLSIQILRHFRSVNFRLDGSFKMPFSRY